MDAAYRQFCEHGLHGVSIEAIADDAGFTRGAFHSNFASREDLFLALAERENGRRLDDVRERFADAITPLRRATGKPGPDLIEEAIANLLPFRPQEQQWCLLNSEFRLLAMRVPEIAPRFLETMHAFERQLSELIDTALASVGLRFVIDSVHLTRMLLDQFESAMQEAILSGADDPEHAVRDYMMRTLPPLVHSLTEIRDPATP